MMGNRIAFLLVIILAFIAIYDSQKSKKIEQTLNDTYERNFYDLVEYTDNVEVSLAKAQISNSAEYGAKNLSDIWRKADLAVSCLSQLPVSHQTLEQAEKFLNQLSDYSYSLAQKTFENHPLSAEDLANLKNMYERCKTLNQTFQELIQSFQSGSIQWSELQKDRESVFAQEVANVSVDSFSTIEKDMQDYEGLIYDGPFSEHMTNPSILGLGDTIYTQEMAREVVEEFLLKERIEEIKYQGMVNGTIKTHRFEVILKNGDSCYFDVTERDGRVLFYSYPKEVVHESIGLEEAKKRAASFLQEHGFESMKESYFTHENGMLTINYAYVQNGVVCYTDLVKVKVALDNGEIIGLETKSYLSSHHQRNFEEPAISMEEAKKKINPNLEITSEGLAVIPTDFQTEIFTYEFKGRVENHDFIVYVNANTGKEEKIFMIVDAPGGELAI